jgi:hypothetical protein
MTIKSKILRYVVHKNLTKSNWSEFEIVVEVDPDKPIKKDVEEIRNEVEKYQSVELDPSDLLPIDAEGSTT